MSLFDRTASGGLDRRAFLTRSSQFLGSAAVLGAGGFLAACGGDDDDAADTGTTAGGSGEVITPKIASSTGVIPIFVQQLAGPLLYGKEFGLNVSQDDVLLLESHTVAVQTVLSHKADVISGSIFGSMAAVSQGLPVKIFAGVRNRDDNVLAGVGAQSFDAIFEEDTRVAADSKGGTANAELQAIINQKKGDGTTVGSLPGFTVLESSGQRLAALAAGQVDAAIVHVDQFWQLQDEKPQAKELARSADVPVYPLAAYAALKPWLDDNQPTATALAASVAAASRAFEGDFNEYKTAVTTLVEEPPSNAQLKRLWEFAVENKIWPTDPVMTKDAYDLSAKLAQTAEVFIEPPSYADAVDVRAMQAAAKT